MNRWGRQRSRGLCIKAKNPLKTLRGRTALLSSCRYVRVWPFRIRKSKWTEFAADADNLNLREHIFEKRQYGARMHMIICKMSM